MNELWNKVLYNYPDIGFVLLSIIVVCLILCFIIIRKFNYKIVDEEEQRIEIKRKRTRSLLSLSFVAVLALFLYSFTGKITLLTLLGIWVSFFGILASIGIFSYQLSISEKTGATNRRILSISEMTKTVISKIDENIMDLQLIKQDQDLKKTIQDWFHNNADPDMMLFYFPYTLCPGFWNYADSLKKDLEDLLDKHDINWLLIGPEFSQKDKDITSIIIDNIRHDYEIIGDGMFKNRMENLLKEQKKQRKKNSKISIQSNEPNKGDELADIVQRKYKNAVEDIIRLKTDYNSFMVYTLSPDENDLFSFSLVLKMKNRRAQEILILDTFNFFTSDLTKVKNNIGISSIMDNNGNFAKESLKNLFKRPNSFLIKDQDIANFIFSMFLESCYKNQKLKQFLEYNLYE